MEPAYAVKLVWIAQAVNKWQTMLGPERIKTEPPRHVENTCTVRRKSVGSVGNGWTNHRSPT